MNLENNIENTTGSYQEIYKLINQLNNINDCIKDNDKKISNELITENYKLDQLINIFSKNKKEDLNYSENKSNELKNIKLKDNDIDINNCSNLILSFNSEDSPIESISETISTLNLDSESSFNILTSNKESKPIENISDSSINISDSSDNISDSSDYISDSSIKYKYNYNKFLKKIKNKKYNSSLNKIINNTECKKKINIKISPETKLNIDINIDNLINIIIK